MNDYNLFFLQTVDVPKIPNNVQGNGVQINPRFRQCILNGEPCKYNEDVRNALKKFTGNERVKYTILTIVTVFMFFVFLMNFMKENKQGISQISILLFIYFAVIIVIITVSIQKMYFGSNALYLADKGEAKCFQYKLHRRLRYAVDPCDGTYYYYADFGDFCVQIPKSANLNYTIIGVVVNIKGREHFYLLV